jgi:hypothetical protein
MIIRCTEALHFGRAESRDDLWRSAGCSRC